MAAEGAGAAGLRIFNFMVEEAVFGAAAGAGAGSGVAGAAGEAGAAAGAFAPGILNLI